MFRVGFSRTMKIPVSTVYEFDLGLHILNFFEQFEVMNVTPRLSLPFESHFNDHSIIEMILTYKNMFTETRFQFFF